MLEKIIEAVRTKVRITCSYAGDEGRFVFEPHVIYTDPIEKQTLVAGFYLGPIVSPSYARRWTEFPASELHEVCCSQVRFQPDDNSRDHVSQVFGTTHLKVE